MKTAKINLYSFSELNEEAQEKAIFEHRNFLDEIGETLENEYGEMVTEYYEHSKEDVIKSIEINEYWYYYNGELAPCLTYTGGHEKSGITELNHFGQIIQL